MHCERNGPLGAFGLVVKEQFVEQRKNTAVLLGLDVRTGESGDAGRMQCFCSVGEGVSLMLSSVNAAEWRNCRDSVEWHHRSLFCLRPCCHPSHHIPAFYGLKGKERKMVVFGYQLPSRYTQTERNVLLNSHQTSF